MGDFGSGPAYGNWGGDLAHSGAARPMESLKGTMGPVFERPPMDSQAQGDSRHQADPGGPKWDDTFRAPQATPTRGTKNY